MANKGLSLDTKIKDVLRAYRDSFSGKTYSEESDVSDPLMDVFGITAELKRENRQYWGRELGMCWQLLVTNVLSHHCKKDYAPAIKIDEDEPCDCCVAKDAIDTKYRIGSGDSGTLKKFKANAKLLKEHGYRPVLLIVREDNLPSAMKACEKGGWTVYQGQETFDYVKELSNFDLQEWLDSCRKSGDFFIDRKMA